MKRILTVAVILAVALLPLMRQGFTAPVAAAEAYCLDPNAPPS
ncbi:MAG: hypothetical protein QM589_01450 [Thermomicrobiales bacterium]